MMTPAPVLTSSAQDSQIAALRRFNRFYTRVIGTLREGLLDSDYSLSEARVLYELATRQESAASEIARDLGLDAGFLSRMLRKFEDAGLLLRTTSTEDARQSKLTLTQQGKRVFADLDERSNRETGSILEGLSPERRSKLIHGMQEIEDALREKPQQIPYILRPHRVGDMGWVVQRHGRLYAEEFGWNESFEAVVARIVADFIDHYNPIRERCWIAERDGENLGCIFLVQHPEEADKAKLRLLLVEPSARGLGLGKALVDECTRFARTAGYKKITLWTHSVLESARRIYARAGYKLIAEEPRHSFGKDVVSETWELVL